MCSKRRRFSGEQKAKVALEALRGERRLQEVASKHQVHPNQVGAWKRQTIEGLGEMFTNGVDRHRRDHESEVRELHAKIGELIVERDFCHAGPVDEPVGAPRDGGTRPSGAEAEPAMPAAVDRALLALRRGEGRERGDTGADASDRRAVPEVSVLRGSPDGPPSAPRGGMHRPRPGRSSDAPAGSSGDLPGAADLLKDLRVERSNHVWCADITDIPVQRGFLYLVAIMDWASRHVLAWRLSNTLDAGFCVEALEEALDRYGTPEIFNTDQGSQVTSFAFTGRLQTPGIGISMEGRGRCMDTIFIERLWRSLKYQVIDLHENADGFTARHLIHDWMGFYNAERPRRDGMPEPQPEDILNQPPDCPTNRGHLNLTGVGRSRSSPSAD